MMILSSKSTLWLVPRVILRKKKKKQPQVSRAPFFFSYFIYLFIFGYAGSLLQILL